MQPTLVVINAGSSSLKFQVYAVDQLRLLCGGLIGGIGTAKARFAVRDDERQSLLDRTYSATEMAHLDVALATLMAWLDEWLPAPPAAVGHRIVHGGPDFSASVVIDDDVVAKLHTYIPLAPLHQRNNLTPVDLVSRRWPQARQVACFDTAFHRHRNPVVEHFAIPTRFHAQGVRRYGFHGLSYDYIAQRLRETHPALARGRVIVAHLGSGASLCALRDGQSVDTTMGFTALDGVPMGTRPGSLDPGVLLWLADQGMSTREIERLLYHESGLKGLSGISGDMRELLASDSPAAALAVACFNYRVAQQIAALCVATGGLDALVFTAGIGEFSAPVRAAVCAHLDWLGIAIDAERNTRHEAVVSTADSRITVLIEPTNEEWVIARETARLIATGLQV